MRIVKFKVYIIHEMIHLSDIHIHIYSSLLNLYLNLLNVELRNKKLFKIQI